MVGYAFTFLADSAECEDLVQNTFLQLWKSDTLFANDKALKSYLFKTIRNKCLNTLKHRKVKHTFQLQENQGLTIDTETIENVILRQESAALLNTAIKLLDSRKKEVLELSLKELSNKTIAVRLGISISTVKSLKWKAYKNLRSYLSKTH